MGEYVRGRARGGAAGCEPIALVEADSAYASKRAFAVANHFRNRAQSGQS